MGSSPILRGGVDAFSALGQPCRPPALEVTMKRGTLVCVDWKDPAVAKGVWVSVRDGERLRPVRHRSVGWVIKWNRKRIVIAMTTSKSDGIGGVLVIPRANALKVRRLRGRR